MRAPPATTCPVSFWRFAGPVLAANIAAIGTGALARHALRNEHEQTQRFGSAAAGFATFWLVATPLWIAWNRRA